jgi:DNA repair photolyase
MMKNKYGTREWSDYSYNIGTGCSHGCLYCYARSFAIDKGIVKSAEDWLNEKINPKKVAMKQPLYDGVVMFPTTHDITPFYLDASIEAVLNLLKVGNKVLIVTKAHLSCMEAMCEAFEGYKDQVEFRVTIGSIYSFISKAWEPGAPAPEERVAALRHVFESGYATSVSMEPMLDESGSVHELIRLVNPYVTGEIWIGKMNKISERVDLSDSKLKMMAMIVETNQSDKWMLRLYDDLKDHRKIRWKDSINKVLKKHKMI